MPGHKSEFGGNRNELTVKRIISPVRIFPILFSSSVISCCMILGSCNSSSTQQIEYDDVRIIAEAVHPILPGATSAQRFGRERPVRSDAGNSDAPSLAYNLPDGWTEIPLTPMRRINVQINGIPQAECYLTLLPGGGTLKANIDRWCQQMQQDPLSDEDLAALPKAPLLGAESILFEINGAFSGGVNSSPIEDARMVVYVLPVGETTVFLKATGPRPLIEQQSETIAAFAASIRLEPSQSQATAPESSLQWQVPDDWKVDSPRPMREVTFISGDKSRCWITLLGGDGGGRLANTNRWLGELGMNPISKEQLAGLPVMKMLGGDATVIEGEGTYSSMGGPPRDGWALIGLIRLLPDRAVFIKLVGPAQEVEAGRDSLMELVSSLEVAR